MFASPTAETSSKIAVIKPDWGAKALNSLAKEEEGRRDQIKTTWLGHACFMVEFPSRSTSTERGVRILFDPVFSDRCSPSQHIGPKRFTRK